VGVTAGVHIWEPYIDHARNIVVRRELEKGSLDPYATMRSVYRQIRSTEIGAESAIPLE
jgi:ABC-type transporter lipoprotein component MlaA